MKISTIQVDIVALLATTVSAQRGFENCDKGSYYCGRKAMSDKGIVPIPNNPIPFPPITASLSKLATLSRDTLTIL
jgi:hypothetical protein